jgi:hypothetical protein
MTEQLIGVVKYLENQNQLKVNQLVGFKLY